MLPQEKFAHAIKVRNRTLGPVAGTTVSPHLDVEVSEDNKFFLRLTKDDINMHKVLQQSTCKHGVRRKVAKRALTALGGISGICGLVNGPEQMGDIKHALQFAESLEEFKASQKRLKVRAAMKKKKKEEDKKKAAEARAVKAQEKRRQLLVQARTKLGLASDAEFSRQHVSSLNAAQLKVCVFVSCIVYNGVL